MVHIDSTLLAQLRADLLTNNYTVRAVRDELTPPVYGLWLQENFLVGIDVQNSTPLTRLAAFALAGEQLTTEQVETLFPDTGVGGLAQLGLLESTGDTHRLAYQLWPQHNRGLDYWILADRKTKPLAQDYVLGPNPAASTLLKYATVPTPTGARAPRVWDLGSGCGVLGIEIALRGMHSTADSADFDGVRIMASDISERAVQLTRFNAALADIDMQVRAGDLLTPGRGERFDLILANPPFVLAPNHDHLYTYRSAGLGPDGLVRQLIAGVGEHLSDEGMAQMLMNWPVREGQTPEDAWQAYLDNHHIDAWMVHRETTPVASYIDLWLRDSGLFPDTDGYRQEFLTWWQFFADAGITDVAFGFVCIRNPRGSAPINEFHTVADAPGISVPWQDIFTTIDWINAQQELSELRLRVSPHVRVSKETTYSSPEPEQTEPEADYGARGEFTHEVTRLSSALGICAPLQVEPIVASFIGACNGQLTVGQLARAIADLSEQPLELIRTYLDPIIRKLITYRMLELTQ